MPRQIGELKIYDLDELSEILGLSKVSLRTYLRENRIKGKKLGTRWYVTEESLKEYFNTDTSNEG